MSSYTSNSLADGTVVVSPKRKYIIREVLGAGGFGITYYATYSSMVNGVPVKVQVALKEFFVNADCMREGQQVTCSKTSAIRVDGARQDFINEARRLRKIGLDHDNIVKVDEVFEANGTAYYMMEYIEGKSLRDFVQARGRLSESDTVALMHPNIDAVAFLHSMKVNHLDIKPGNIMLATTDDGSIRPVLIDFGLSRHYGEDGVLTSSVYGQGYSDGFAPAEQYTGITQFSPQADVYALAATILYCLSGRIPPKATDLNDDIIDSLLPRETSRYMRRMLHDALAIRKDDRMKTPEEMLKALGLPRLNNRKGSTVLLNGNNGNSEKPTQRMASDNPPNPSGNPGNSDGSEKKPRKSRAWLWGLIGGLVAAAIAAGTYFYFVGSGSSSESSGDRKSDKTEDTVEDSTSDYSTLDDFERISNYRNIDKAGFLYYQDIFNNGLADDYISAYDRFPDNTPIPFNDHIAYAWCLYSKDRDSEAVSVFRMVYENDNYEGSVGLGVCYLYGYGIDKDEDLGVYLLNEAISHDIPEAYAFLGLYKQNQGYTNEANRLLKKARQMGIIVD